MTGKESGGRVLLAEQQPASAVLHSVLAHTVQAFPEALAEVGLPAGAKQFRKDYPECLPAFEAARTGSARRMEIARAAVAELRRHLIWQGPEGMLPLGEALAVPAAPLPLDVHEFNGEPGWEPGLTYRGERWAGPRLSALADDLVSRGMATGAAGSALNWLAAECLEDGCLHLRRRKIAVLGAGAEMAPTRFWLEAGAEVLWLDVVPPPTAWRELPGMAGRLHWPATGVDLLARPQEVLATLMAFADGEPVDLGLYAYAPGQARELLLTGVMNEIVNALPRSLLRTVTLLVSPTTPTALTAEDRPAMEARLEDRPGWETVLDRLGLLGRGGGSARVGDGRATRSVVGIQGASYQAAQYLGKVLVAECWANDDAGEPLRISANTAAITRTRSLNHPVFAAAFGGAAAFKVETLTPRFSRRLNGLLAVRDWFCPEPPTPGRVRIHGGIHTLPYPLDPALRVAAAMGFARSPRLLGGLIRR
jgi:hypothetical protein